MPPEDIPEDRDMSFICECGGDITYDDNFWECDNCNCKFKKRENIESTITS